MPDTDHGARLADMRAARVDAMRLRARRDIAMDLLEANGEVTAGEIDAHMAEWAAPDDSTLDNLMAQKTASGIDSASADLMAARIGLAKIDEKAAKARAFVDSVEQSRAVMTAMVADAEAAVADARSLAAYAGGLGDASAASAPEFVQVTAATADADGSN